MGAGRRTVIWCPPHQGSARWDVLNTRSLDSSRKRRTVVGFPVAPRCPPPTAPARLPIPASSSPAPPPHPCLELAGAASPSFPLLSILSPPSAASTRAFPIPFRRRLRRALAPPYTTPAPSPPPPLSIPLPSTAESVPPPETLATLDSACLLRRRLVSCTNGGSSPPDQQRPGPSPPRSIPERRMHDTGSQPRPGASESTAGASSTRGTWWPAGTTKAVRRCCLPGAAAAQVDMLLPLGENQADVPEIYRLTAKMKETPRLTEDTELPCKA